MIIFIDEIRSRVTFPFIKKGIVILVMIQNSMDKSYGRVGGSQLHYSQCLVIRACRVGMLHNQC